MTSTTVIGLIIIVGMIFGRLAEKVGLPKVTGFILAGIILNPHVFNIIPPNFPEMTQPVTNICLAFITFEVGGTLEIAKIKRLGKTILSITFFEAFGAFLFVLLGNLLFSVLFIHKLNTLPYAAMFVPVSILIASMASPTDPTATLAVIHEYKAKGEVTDTIMGVAAFDDAFGIIIFSISIGFALFFSGNKAVSFSHILGNSAYIILGGIIFGIIFGMIFNFVTHFFKIRRQTVLISLILGLLALCFGIANILHIDPLLSTMSMGFTVVNYNRQKFKIFHILQRYTEELIFIFFFTLSGMHLDFSLLDEAVPLVIIFVIFRFLGKTTGVFIGANLSKASKKIKTYTAGGLFPQGGIVIGLALTVHQNPHFEKFSGLILAVIMSTVIIHEILGPIISKMTLKLAKEI